MKYGIAYHREQNAPLILVQSFRRGQVPIALAGLIDGTNRKEQGEQLMQLLEGLPWKQKKWCAADFFEAGVRALQEWAEQLKAADTRLALVFAVGNRVYLHQNTRCCFLVQRWMGTGRVMSLPEQFAGQMELGTCMLFADRTYLAGSAEEIGEALFAGEQGMEQKLRRRLAELSSGSGGGFVFLLQEEEDET